MNGLTFSRMGVNVNKSFKTNFLKYYSKWLHTGLREYRTAGGMRENNFLNDMLRLGIY